MTVELNLLILLILSISSIVISVACCIFSIFALKYSVAANVAVGALEKSTHSVQYMPIDPKIDLENQEWVTKQEVLDKEREMFKKDIEDEMPEFAGDEDDNKVYTF